MSSEWVRDERFFKESLGSGTKTFEPFSAQQQGRDTHISKPASIQNGGSTDAPRNSDDLFSREQLEQEKAQAVQKREDELRAEQTEISRQRDSQLREEFEEFLASISRYVVEQEPLYEAVRRLSLAFAQEIAMHFIDSDIYDYESVLKNTLRGSDIGLKGDLEFRVSTGWKEKMAHLGLGDALSHVAIIPDDKLKDGDVIVRSKEAVLSNLVSQRVSDLKEQLAEMTYTRIGSEVPLGEQRNGPLDVPIPQEVETTKAESSNADPESQFSDGVGALDEKLSEE